MRNLGTWFLDSRWFGPLVSFVAVALSVLINVDYSGLQTKHPSWAGILGILGVAVPVFLVMAALIQAALEAGRKVREPTINQLQAQLSDYRSQTEEFGNDITNVFDGLLLQFSHRLELQQNDQVRISLYIHDNEADRFIPCGRYSPNPAYRGRGRTSYPGNEGCIAKGWLNSWHFENDIPADRAERRRYEKESYGISKAVSEKLKMQSRLYAVKRIEYENQALGVIVVEAEEPNRFEQVPLQSVLTDHSDTIGAVVKRLRGYIPNPATAEAKGL